MTSKTMSIQHYQITLFTSFNRGMRLEAIAALLGHQKMEMTLIYANPRELHQMGAFALVG